jgi:hypothetical protein
VAQSIGIKICSVALVAVEAIQALVVRLHGGVGQLIGADLDEGSGIVKFPVMT